MLEPDKMSHQELCRSHRLEEALLALIAARPAETLQTATKSQNICTAPTPSKLQYSTVADSAVAQLVKDVGD
jgi:hypothetical protein